MPAAPEGATAVEWVMKTEGVTRRRAIALVKTGAKKLPLLLEGKEEDAEISEKVMGLYEETLARTEDARAWLAARHIHAEAIRGHRVGFSEGTLTMRLPGRWRRGRWRR